MHDPDREQEGLLSGDLDMTPDEVTCQQFVELITDYFEGTLTSRTLSQVEEHLVLCDWCVSYMHQMQATIVALGSLREHQEVEPPESVISVLRAKRGSGR
jgi:predicted anti-sigma-YlaC factor YlaD